MDLAARATSKGQVTIPKEVRDKLGIAQGDQIVFGVEAHRAMFAKTPNLLGLSGVVEVPAAKRATASDGVLLLPDLIVSEVVYVLESFNEVPIDEVARLVRSVIAFAQTRTLDPSLLLRALDV